MAVSLALGRRMPQSRIMTKAAVFCLAAGMASAQTVSLTVNTGTVLHTIDPKMYGQSLEPIYHSVNGGIWGEVVWNRSFEETLTQGAWKAAWPGSSLVVGRPSEIHRSRGPLRSLTLSWP